MPAARTISFRSSGGVAICPSYDPISPLRWQLTQVNIVPSTETSPLITACIGSPEGRSPSRYIRSPRRSDSCDDRAGTGGTLAAEAMDGRMSTEKAIARRRRLLSTDPFDIHRAFLILWPSCTLP